MFENEELYYQLVIVSGAGEGNGLYSYWHDLKKNNEAPKKGYYGGRYKINLGFNKILCWELLSAGAFTDGDYVERILYEKIDNEWQCIDGKNPPPKEVETIHIDAAFLEKNIQKKEQIKPRYDESVESCSVMEMIEEMIEEEFIVGILMSMLFCSHMSLSVMYVHYSAHNFNQGWLALICEQCDEKWEAGENHISVNKVDRIHIKYGKERCGMGIVHGAQYTSPYHSLENKREKTKNKTTETK
eukprot:522170_1